MKNFKWDKKYLYWGVTAFCVIVACITFFWVLNRWSGLMGVVSLVIRTLSPFIYGMLIAYLLNTILSLFEKHVFIKLAHKLYPHSDPTAKKFARITSIIATEIVAIGVVAGILIMILPQLYYSILGLVEKSSKYFEIVVKWVGDFMDGNTNLEATAMSWLNSFSKKLMEWIETDVLPQMSKIITDVTGGVITFAKGIINLLIGAVLSIYIMYHKETFAAQGKKIVYSILKPRAANRLMDEMDFINKAFGDYIAGTILDSLIVGICNYIFMVIVGMPYAALISIIVAITNIIPVFGPFIGAIPSALLILLESPMQCLVFIIFTIVLQQIDGNLIKPQIHGSKSGISGFWVMFAILFFGGLFGIVGMLLGVPVVIVLYNAIKRGNAKRLLAKGLPFETPEYKNIYRINPETNTPVYKVSHQQSGSEPPKGGNSQHEKETVNESSGD